MTNIEKVNGLVRLTILPALAEDFVYKNAAEAEEVLRILKERVNAISIDDFTIPLQLLKDNLEEEQ